MLRAATALLLGLLALPLRGEELPLNRFQSVNVAPAKTSIYVGVVSMTLSTFNRKAAAYEATYEAKVFPYFFYNETGSFTVEISDAQLRQLENGATIEFKGRGVSGDGAERAVEGKATPSDTLSGKLKVRVRVSKRVELIFNTTYRFSS
jgi:hypothetical protein